LTKPSRKTDNSNDSTVLAIGDLHLPFAHPDHLPFLEACYSNYKCTRVVCLGDEIDSYAVSNYSHDPDGYSAGHEFEEALKGLHLLYKVFPKVEVCASNHTARPWKLAARSGLPERFLRDVKTVLEAPAGWSWADHVQVDGVIYEHGEGFTGPQAAIKAAVSNGCSTVIGHIHAYAGIAYSSLGETHLSGTNVGCLIDDTKYAFAYARHFKSRPWIGVGIVDRGVPRLIPMLMDKRKRWTGKLPA
jgi:hypothetical protein